MKIGILGSGAVGKTLAKGFNNEGHEVWIATREPDGEKGVSLRTELPGVTVADFAAVAAAAELAVLCVKWPGVEETLRGIGADSLAGKIVIDTSNIIKPAGEVMVYGGGDTSAAAQVQQWLPNSKVVKAFNTVGAVMMYKPQLSATPTMFVAGDDADAKAQVADLIKLFGWEPLDTGPLVAARELEAMALVWIRHSMGSGNPQHAFKML